MTRSKDQPQNLMKNNFLGDKNDKENVVKTLNRPSKEVEDVSKMLRAPITMTKEQLLDRQNCFESFRRSYRKAEAINENMTILKKMYDKGKDLSNIVKVSRSNVEKYKNKIEDIR